VQPRPGTTGPPPHAASIASGLSVEALSYGFFVEHVRPNQDGVLPESAPCVSGEPPMCRRRRRAHVSQADSYDSSRGFCITVPRATSSLVSLASGNRKCRSSRNRLVKEAGAADAVVLWCRFDERRPPRTEPCWNVTGSLRAKPRDGSGHQPILGLPGIPVVTRTSGPTCARCSSVGCTACVGSGCRLAGRLVAARMIEPSDKPSDNDPGQRPTERDAPRHRYRSGLRCSDPARRHRTEPVCMVRRRSGLWRHRHRRATGSSRPARL
jgi:hypothetical protein